MALERRSIFTDKIGPRYTRMLYIQHFYSLGTIHNIEEAGQLIVSLVRSHDVDDIIEGARDPACASQSVLWYCAASYFAQLLVLKSLYAFDAGGTPIRATSAGFPRALPQWVCTDWRYETVLFAYFLHFFLAQPCSQDGDTRLLNFTSDVYAGFVEVCLDGTWGTICADSPTTLWSEKNAQVFCIGLGYSGALNSVNQST